MVNATVQHLDTPDNNPDLPWEFTDTNKEKVSKVAGELPSFELSD